MSKLKRIDIKEIIEFDNNMLIKLIRGDKLEYIREYSEGTLRLTFINDDDELQKENEIAEIKKRSILGKNFTRVEIEEQIQELFTLLAMLKEKDH